jgi:hypothetical protein
MSDTERDKIARKLYKDGLSRREARDELCLSNNQMSGLSNKLQLHWSLSKEDRATGIKPQSRPRKASKPGGAKKVKKVAGRLPDWGNPGKPSRSALALIDSVPAPKIVFDFSPESLMPHLYHPERYKP